MMAAGEDYALRDRALAETFAHAARLTGVERIIYLGGLGETGAGLSEHLRSRREIEAALASTGVPVTVLRAAMIVGSGSASYEILRYLVSRPHSPPELPLDSSGDSHQPSDRPPTRRGSPQQGGLQE